MRACKWRAASDYLGDERPAPELCTYYDYISEVLPYLDASDALPEGYASLAEFN